MVQRWICSIYLIINLYCFILIRFIFLPCYVTYCKLLQGRGEKLEKQRKRKSVEYVTPEIEFEIMKNRFLKNVQAPKNS